MPFKVALGDLKISLDATYEQPQLRSATRDPVAAVAQSSAAPVAAADRANLGAGMAARSSSSEGWNYEKRRVRRMPRIVDTEARREQIVAAATKLLSEGGFVRLTLSNLAKELGGSMRLVTHYFRDRTDLITALLENGIRETDELLDELDRIEDARARLRYALEWFLPLDPATLQLEKVRVALVVHKDVEPVIAEFFSSVDLAMRRVLKAAVMPIADAADVDLLVDVLRAWTSGVALASVEHPEIWTPERQRAVLDDFLARFDFGSARSA